MATETQPKNSYKDTLNLPQTSFAMEAKLVQNEPGRLKKWQEQRLYEQIQTGRSRRRSGFCTMGRRSPMATSISGTSSTRRLRTSSCAFARWRDTRRPMCRAGTAMACRSSTKSRNRSRRKAKTSARWTWWKSASAASSTPEKYADIQSEQFQRLGILGDWDNPYLTMKPAYEAQTLEVFARMVEKGLVYRKLKPVPWSIANQTALADAELEYQDVVDNSVYVEFPLLAPIDGTPAFCLSGRRRHGRCRRIWRSPLMRRWTIRWCATTAVGADRLAVVATELRERVFARRECIRMPSFGTGTFDDLLGERRSIAIRSSIAPARIVAADYVTTTDGTGLVHTAPGHGEDDYETGIAKACRFTAPCCQWPVRRHRSRMASRANRLQGPIRYRRALGRLGALLPREDHAQLSARLAEQDADHLPRDRAVVHRHR